MVGIVSASSEGEMMGRPRGTDYRLASITIDCDGNSFKN